MTDDLTPFENHSAVFRQIALLLRQRIGVEWFPGDELPSEAQLAAAYGVNRHTLRRAVALLVDDHILERRRGKRLRVAKSPDPERPKIEADPITLFQMRPGTQFKVLSFKKVTLPPDATRQLHLPPGAAGYQLDRLLVEKNDILAYLISYIPVEIGKRLRRSDLKVRTLSSILSEDLDITIGKITQYIEAALADAEIATALGTAPGSATLKCRYHFERDDAVPLMSLTWFYNAERYRLSVNILPTESTAGEADRRILTWPLTAVHTQE